MNEYLLQGSSRYTLLVFLVLCPRSRGDTWISIAWEKDA